MSPPLLLKDKVAIVTGASAGIGRATALLLTKKGAKVGAIARDTEGLASLKREIEELGGTAAIAHADVSDFEALSKAAENILEALGPVDIWINNAMVSVFSPVVETSPEEFRRVTEVTYLGVVWGTKIALKHMQEKDRGTILLVGSALAYRGIPLQAPYCAAKHAIHGFYESLRSELLHDRSSIRLLMVQLPAFNTPQFAWSRSHMAHEAKPVPPIYQPESAADSIVRAIGWGKPEVLVGLPSIEVVLSNAFMPRLLDRYLARTGYKSQQLDEVRDSRKSDNLLKPAEATFTAHGRFDADAQYARLLLITQEELTMIFFLIILTLLGLGFSIARLV